MRCGGVEFRSCSVWLRNRILRIGGVGKEGRGGEAIVVNGKLEKNRGRDFDTNQQAAAYSVLYLDVSPVPRHAEL